MVSPRRNTLLTFNCGVRSFPRFVSRFCRVFQRVHTDSGVQETNKVVTSRAIVLVLRKKEAQAEYWPRLTKEKPNRNWVKTDFSKVR